MENQNSSDSQCLTQQTEVFSRLADLMFNTVRRYDVLVREHTQMHLTDKSLSEKECLSSAFVTKTMSDLMAILNDETFKQTITNYVCDCTNAVVAKCSDNDLVTPKSLPRVNFLYLYYLYLAPTHWVNEIRRWESLFYRDMTNVYERYVFVKTALTETFNTFTEAILKALFRH